MISQSSLPEFESLLVAMQYFMLLLYFSTFIVISSFPIFNEGNDGDPYIALGSNDRFGQSIDTVEYSTLSQSNSLLPVAPSPASTELNNYGNRFDPIPLDDKEQNVPVLDSSILMAGNSPNKDTQDQRCHREKEVTKRILCFAAIWCTYDASA